MIANKTARVAAGIGAGALLFATAVLPAQADPAAGTFGTLVGLGSDTTQDVMNGLAAGIPDNILASYNATGGGTVVTRSGGAAIPRANGSGSGVSLLRVTIGQTGNANISTFSAGSASVVTADVAGLVDFARSSSGAGSNAEDDGILAYIPFGVDAVTYAISPTSVLPQDLTRAELVSIYKGEYNRVAYKSGEDSVLLNATAAVPTGFTAVAITTFIPQSGSGTRSYWLGQMSISETEISAGTYNNLRDKDLNDADVQEHKGAALVSGSAELQKATIVPFSIAQWISQGNDKVADARDGAQLGGVTVDSVLQEPTTGTAPNFVLNPAYNAYTRSVYNVVPSRDADNPTTLINKTFVGANSTVCLAQDIIKSYGFGVASNCGSTASRAYKASEATLVPTIPAAAQAGVASTLSAKVTSFGNGGGKVTFKNGETVLATATINKGSDTGSVQWTPSAAGALNITAEFLPNYAGVGAAVSEASPVTVSAAAAPTATSVALAASANPTAGQNVTVTATITKPAVAGTVAFFDGTKALGAPVNVAAAATTAATTFKASKLNYSVRAVFTPAAATAAASNATLAVKVAKAKPTFKVGKVKSKKKGANVKLTVKAAGIKVTGKVVAKVGKKKVGTVKVKNGKATIKLKKLKSGKNKVKFNYKGANLVAKVKANKNVTAK